MSRKKILTIATYLEIFFDASKTGQNEEPYIFQEIAIPKVIVQLFEKCQSLIALQVWCLGTTKNIEWFANGTALWKNGLNSFRDKNVQKLVKCKVQITWDVKEISTHSAKASVNDTLMVLSHLLIGAGNF